jgi:mannitol/fructose-specific phosphotransferase system IIA component
MLPRCHYTLYVRMNKLLLIVFFSPLWLTNANGQAKKCLLDYQTKLDQLLPLSVIQKHYTGDMSKAKKNYYFRPEAKKHDTDTYEYTWPSKRTRKMMLMGQEQEMPDNNRIGLKWVANDMFLITRKATPLESFKAFYRNATAAEKEAAFKKAGEQLKAKGYDEKTTKTATSMGKELAADDIIFKDIQGVGQAAAWRIKDKELIVLVDGITFQVVANVSANDDENIALAKKIAAEVLAKCK